MNRRRVAALLRELADELERDEQPANDCPRRRRARPAPLPLVAPPRPPSELDMQRAKDALRRTGYRVKP